MLRAGSGWEGGGVGAVSGRWLSVTNLMRSSGVNEREGGKPGNKGCRVLWGKVQGGDCGPLENIMCELCKRMMHNHCFAN